MPHLFILHAPGWHSEYHRRSCAATSSWSDQKRKCSFLQALNRLVWWQHWEGLGSSFGWLNKQADLTNVFHDFQQFLQENGKTVPHLDHGPFLPNSFSSSSSIHQSMLQGLQ
jgi:hypothetical protein